MGGFPVVGGIHEGLNEVGGGALVGVVSVADHVDCADGEVERLVFEIDPRGEDAHRDDGRVEVVRVVVVAEGGVGEDAADGAAAGRSGDDRAGGAGGRERPVGVGDQVVELVLGPAV